MISFYSPALATLRDSVRHLCLIVLVTLLPTINAVARPTAPLSIYVSILPQKYLVERIGLPYVTVSTMVGPGQSPATYEPTPRQMSQLGNCAAYLRIEVPFENSWMHKLAQANPGMRVINVNTGDIVHSHDKGLDPHTWTSPPLLKVIAHNIKNALSQIDPGHAEAYGSNLQKLLQELQQLDQQIRALLQERKVTHFMVYHPAWGHFAAAYGLSQIAIEQQGKEPGAKTLTQIIAKAKQLGLHRIFVQAQFNQRSVKIIADAINGKTLVVDPLAENVITNLLHFAQLLATGDAI